VHRISAELETRIFKQNLDKSFVFRNGLELSGFMIKLSGICWNFLEYAGTFWNMLKLCGTCMNFPEYAGAFRNVLERS
jgi:hypothetical protein